jgi:hypothetical protein
LLQRWHGFGRIAALLTTATLLASCASFVDQRVQGIIERELPCVVGPAQRYKVEVSGSNTGASRFERIGVTGYRVARSGAPIADVVTLDMRDVQVDRESGVLTAIGAANMQLRFLRADLASFLEGSGPFENVGLALHPPNAVVIDGRPRIAGIGLLTGATFEARGRIVARNQELRLELDDLRALGFSAPPLWRGVAQLAINPLFDAKAFPVPSRFDQVNIEGQAIVISASGAGAGSSQAQKKHFAYARAEPHCGPRTTGATRG